MIRPHGLRGAVVVEPFTDDPARRFAPSSSLTLSGGDPVEITGYEPTDRFPILTLAGFDTRSEAEALRGRELYVRPEERRALGPDEFWPDQLEGLQVVGTDGSVVGTVTRIETGPTQDRLVLDCDGEELMIPLVTALVPEVDLAGGRVVVDLPPGFIPGN